MRYLVALLSLDNQQHIEPFRAMLKWAEPPFHQSPKVESKTYRYHNLALGAGSEECFALDPSEQVACVAIGSMSNSHVASKVIDAYLRLDTQAFGTLDGEFAIILLDKRKNQIYALRDRLGICPLYWSVQQNSVLLATSIKAILGTGFVSPSPDFQGIASMLSMGFISQDVTSIEKVNRLLPGYTLTLSLAGSMSIQSFWSFSSKFATEYATEFDSSLDIYCELSRKITNAIQVREIKQAACLATSSGSLLIKNSLKGESKLYEPTLTPAEFLENLVPMVWAMEMPHAQAGAAQTFQFLKMCKKNNATCFFDSGYHEEFYDYSNEVECLKSWKPRMPEKHESLLNRLGFKLFPRNFFKQLRQNLRARPQRTFFQKKLVFPHEEFQKALPELSHHFDLDLFIHEFYNLSRLEKVDASLFYLSIKTTSTDGVSDCRLRLAESFNVPAVSPFLDVELLEFFASLSPEVWASPDLLAAFPNYWLEQNSLSPITFNPTQELSKLMLAPVVLSYLKGLERGLLVESEYVARRWIKEALKAPQNHIMELYALLVLEIWMKLYIDLSLHESNPHLHLSDIITPQSAAY